MFRFIILMSLIFSTASCSKKNKNHGLFIDTAQFSKSISVLNTFPTDKKRCWGVDVSANDIPVQPYHSCRPQLGIASGFVEEGEPLEVFVPQGDNRTIRVVASLVNLSDSCPLIATHNNYSNSYLIHEQTLDLNEAEVTLFVEATYPGDSFDIASLLNLDTSSCSTTSDSLILSEVQPIYPINGSDWNDYVDNSLTALPPFLQTDSPCPLTGNRYSSCLHAGEFRKVDVQGASSCDGLTAHDDLLAFTWVCIDHGPYVSFYSLNLKPGKSLADLLDSNGWLYNKVTVTNTVTQNQSSTVPSQWWSNTVTPLPDSSGAPQNLATQGTIYFEDSIVNSHGYQITADNIAITTLGIGRLEAVMTDNCNIATVTTGGSEECLILANSRKHLWIEGDFIKTSAGVDSHAILFNNTQFSRINHVKTLSFISSLTLYLSNNNFISNYEAGGKFNTGIKDGIEVISSNYNLFRKMNISNHDQGMNFLVGSDHNSVFGAHLSNNYNEGLLVSSSENTFVDILSHHNSTNGITSDGSKNTFAFSSAIANTIHGFSITATSNNDLHSIIGAANTAGLRLTNVNSSQISDFVGTNNTYGIDLGGTNTANNIVGYTLVGANTSDCGTSYAGINFTDAICTGLTGLHAGKTLASAFLGKVTTNDLTNPDDSAGSILEAALTHWVGFDNFYRGWGEELATDLTQANQRCQAGDTCRIYDYQLLQSDNVVYNNSFDGINSNPNIVDNTPCPSALNGASAYVDQQTAPNTFLLRAIEIVGDSIGDDDALCESNENCIYTPNIGHYQGDGILVKMNCNFIDGAVTGVQLFQYINNGI